ncbi:MAG: class I SAM-dependent methyltransferase [bacterium]|nr:class I SAM-dependent methyltransferase [bacterium]
MENTDKRLAEIYNDLDELNNDFRNANLTSKLVQLVSGNSVLEIGCGNGTLLGELTKVGKRVKGIESNPEIISLAKKINANLNIVQGFAEDLDGILTEKFDNILMIDVVEHIEDDDGLLIRLGKFLEDSGELIIFVPAYQSLYGKRDKEIGHYRRYNKKTLRILIESNGFEVVKMNYWNMLGILPYIISEKVFNKPLETTLRNKKQKNPIKRIISRFLFYWFKYIENNINLGFGLSLICIAKKK